MTWAACRGRSGRRRRKKPIDPAAAGLILLPDAATVEAVVQPPPSLTPAEREQVDTATEALREAAALADRVGLPVAMGASLAETADLVALLRVIDGPLLFRELDTAAAAGEDLEFAVGEAPAVLHVRCRDARLGVGGRAQPAKVGQGDVDWPQVLALLRDADYRGPLTLAGPLPDATAAMSRLSSL